MLALTGLATLVPAVRAGRLSTVQAITAAQAPAGGHGARRPRTRPDRVLGDKAYGSRTNRGYLRRHGVRCALPEQKDRVDGGRLLVAAHRVG